MPEKGIGRHRRMPPPEPEPVRRVLEGDERTAGARAILHVIGENNLLSNALRPIPGRIGEAQSFAEGYQHITLTEVTKGDQTRIEASFQVERRRGRGLSLVDPNQDRDYDDRVYLSRWGRRRVINTIGHPFTPLIRGRRSDDDSSVSPVAFGQGEIRVTSTGAVTVFVRQQPTA